MFLKYIFFLPFQKNSQMPDLFEKTVKINQKIISIQTRVAYNWTDLKRLNSKKGIISYKSKKDILFLDVVILDVSISHQE